MKNLKYCYSIILVAILVSWKPSRFVSIRKANRYENFGPIPSIRGTPAGIDTWAHGDVGAPCRRGAAALSSPPSPFSLWRHARCIEWRENQLSLQHRRRACCARDLSWSLPPCATCTQKESHMQRDSLKMLIASIKKRQVAWLWCQSPRALKANRENRVFQSRDRAIKKNKWLRLATWSHSELPLNCIMLRSDIAYCYLSSIARQSRSPSN